MIEIEKGIPLPEVKRGRKGNYRYPWRDMAIGDSFLAPDADIRYMAASAVGARKRLGRRFACRTVEGGVRVWRIE